MAVRKRKDSPYYQTDFSFKGKRWRESTNTSNKQLAEEFESQLKARVYNGLILGKKQDANFSEVATEYIKHYLPKLSKKYQQDGLRYIERFASFVKNNEVTKEAIQDYINLRRNQSATDRTITAELATLSSVLTYGVNSGFIANNPVKEINKKQFKANSSRIRFLTKEEYTSILSSCNDYIELKNAIILAKETGLRKEELLSLKLTQIDFTNKELSVFKTKNGKARTIPISPEAFNIIEQAKNNNQIYAVENKGKRVKDFKKSFNARVAKSNIEDFHWHDLRHTFATWALKSWHPWQKEPFDLYKLQKWLGHSTIQMTMIYAHLELKDLHGMVSRN